MRHPFLCSSALVPGFVVLSGLVAGHVQAEPVTYVIEPTHTFATFEIGHFGTSTNRARFDRKEGTVIFDRVAKTGKVDVTIDATSVNSGTPLFDKHLQEEDFFNTARFPTIHFSSDAFRFQGDKVSEVVGKLTLLGKTEPVTLKATQFNCYDSPILKREVCGGDFETVIDRTRWGMNYGPTYPKNVRLIIQVEAVRQ